MPTPPKKGKRISTRYTGIALLAAVVLAVAVYLAGGTKLHRSEGGREAEIAGNVALLRALEDSEVPDLDAAVKRRKKAELDARQGVLVDDLAAEEEKILTMEEPGRAELRMRFQGAAIVGDSIADDAVGYNWLDETVVFAKVGASVSEKSYIIQNVIAARPSVLFFVFGINDIESCKEDYQSFISRYTDCILAVRQALPDSVIYIHAVFPPKDLSKKPYYQYLDQYNEAQQAMCARMGVYFVDGSFILREKPSLYEPDQIHMDNHFYPMWLTYLADIAGLNGNEQ